MNKALYVDIVAAKKVNITIMIGSYRHGDLYRGVQKLEEGGVRASFMSAVQVMAALPS